MSPPQVKGRTSAFCSPLLPLLLADPAMAFPPAFSRSMSSSRFTMLSRSVPTASYGGLKAVDGKVLSKGHDISRVSHTTA